MNDIQFQINTFKYLFPTLLNLYIYILRRSPQVNIIYQQCHYNIFVKDIDEKIYLYTPFDNKIRLVLRTANFKPLRLLNATKYYRETTRDDIFLYSFLKSQLVRQQQLLVLRNMCTCGILVPTPFGLFTSKRRIHIFIVSVVFQDVSLNRVLSSGPDLANNFVGILKRFYQYAKVIKKGYLKMLYVFFVYN